MSAVSSDIETHGLPGTVRVHRAALDANDAMLFARRGSGQIDDRPDHDEISAREQRWLLDAIRNDTDLSQHWADAVNSLRIVLAADESIRQSRVVTLT